MEKSNNVECIITAAGLSTRMHQWKMLLPYQHKTILEICIDNALSFCSKVILVVGYRADELKSYFSERPNIEVVENSHYKDGLMSSIQCGMQYVRAPFFFICHGDMPCISTDIYENLWRNRDNKKVIFPGTKKLTGHPVLMPKKIIKVVNDDSRITSMKRISFQFGATFLQLTNNEIHQDIDNEEDYKRYNQR